MSFVNKSGKRFVPKAGGRRPGRELSVGGTKIGGEKSAFEGDFEDEGGPKSVRSFAQPQRRLSSLTAPTQLLESSSSVLPPPRSRRGSASVTRRSSIAKSSRRGSAVAVEDVAVGGVVTGSGKSWDSGVSSVGSVAGGVQMGEPIRVVQNRRKSSVSGIPIVTKRRRSSTRLSVDMSPAVKQRVKDAVRGVERRKRATDASAQNTVSVTPTPMGPPARTPREAAATVVEEEPESVVISREEQDAQFKWMMSRKTKKLVRVQVSTLQVRAEAEVEFQEAMEGKRDEAVKIEEGEFHVPSEAVRDEYNVGFKIESVKQLSDLRTSDDAHLTQHIKINEEMMTMGDLCKPFFPIGEVSKNYERALEGERKRREKREQDAHRRREARRFRLNAAQMDRFENVEEDEKNGDQKAKIRELMEKDLSEDQNKTHRAPVLVLDGGKIGYSHESTKVNRHEGESGAGLERVEENPFENIVTSNTYSKKKQTLRWTPQETAELFKAISLWGTDFSLIAQLFPYRTRKQIKAKFVLEEKKHPHLVEFALLRKLPLDVAEYSGKSGKMFKTLDEYNEDLRNLKQKHEAELVTISAARAVAMAEDRQTQAANSSAPPKPRSRKAVIAEFRRGEEVVGSLD